MIRPFNYNIYLSLLVLAVFYAPTVVFAEGYVNLVGIPGLAVDSVDFQEVLNTVFRITIIAAALIAVVKLILAGAKYVFSGLVTEKTDAKNDIQSALVGLLIILSAVLLLRTINPDIVNLPALPDLSISQNIAPGGPTDRCPAGTRYVRTSYGSECEEVASSDPIRYFENEIPEDPDNIFPLQYEIPGTARNDWEANGPLGQLGINDDNFTLRVRSMLPVAEGTYNDTVRDYWIAQGLGANDITTDNNPESLYLDNVLLPACRNSGGSQVVVAPANSRSTMFIYCVTN